MKNKPNHEDYGDKPTFASFVPPDPIEPSESVANHLEDKVGISEEEPEKLDVETIAALEAALRVRDPYTGRMHPSDNDIERQAELEARKTEKGSSHSLKKPHSVLPEVPVLRSRPTAIAMICVLCAAIAFVAYGSLRSKKSEAKTLDSIPSEPIQVVADQKQQNETEKKPAQPPKSEDISMAQIAISTSVESESADNSQADEKAEYDSIMEKAAKAKSRPHRMELLREAITLNPEEDEAHSRLAVMMVEYPKNRDEALSLATKAVESNPGNARAWLAIGYIHQQRKDREAANEAYSKCSEAKGPEEFVKECKALLPSEHRP